MGDSRLDELAEARTRAKRALHHAIIGFDRDKRPITLYQLLRDVTNGDPEITLNAVAWAYDTEMAASWEALFKPIAVRPSRPKKWWPSRDAIADIAGWTVVFVFFGVLLLAFAQAVLK